MSITLAESRHLQDAVARTRCFECGKWKSTTVAYSEKQQNDLRNGLASRQIKRDDMAKGWITCRACVGVQKAEMQCVVCEKVKGLDGFAKTQRRDPDNAVSCLPNRRQVETCDSSLQRCLICVAVHVNAAPHEKTTGAEDDALDSGSDSDDTESNIYGSVSLPRNTSKQCLTFRGLEHQRH